MKWKIFLSVIVLTTGLMFAKLSPSPVFAMNNDFPSKINATLNGKTGDYQNNASSINQNFDWRWLLPLLSVPIIYFLWQNSSLPREERGTTHPFSQSIVGHKGGRVNTKKKIKQE